MTFSARGVSAAFGAVRALDGVDFDVDAGEIRALMGENGAGKSTLIRAITGVRPPDAGTMTLDGATYAPRDAREAEARGVACVHQEVRLPLRLSVSDVLALGRARAPFGFLRRAAEERRARAALARVGLDLDPRSAVGDHPLAVRQLVAIARALDLDARLLVLDEPTSSLDAPDVARLFALLRDLRARGLAIVFVSHFLDQLYDLCDRITVLRDGKTAGTRRLADLPRSELVALMLGRPAPDDATRPAPRGETAPPVYAARGLARAGAISAFDLELRAGETVGLAGLLGSGRTETARLVAGLDAPDAGTATLDGRAVSWNGPRAALRAGVAFTPEDRKAEGFAPNLSVRENLLLAMQASRGFWRRIPAAERRRAADELIARLRIRCSGPEQPVGELSGGNQQKVVLASRLLLRPRVLVLDEPTRGVDVGARAELEEEIDARRRDGAALLLVTSELDRLVRASDRLLVLRDRRVVARLAGAEATEAAVRAALSADAAARPAESPRAE
jgi:monosaccharide-transporting ATPase